MDSDSEMREANGQGPSLLDLSYELRQIILRYALREVGTVELQYPVWAGMQTFRNPLFHISRSLRVEALEAFYQTNDFLWVVHAPKPLGGSIRSNPATYNNEPAMTDISSPLLPPPFTSALPWLYPKLMQHLRNLHINICLPKSGESTTDLYHWLESCVKSLDYGRRLSSVRVSIIAKDGARGVRLSTEEAQTLELLAQMRVKGSVEVRPLGYLGAKKVVDRMALSSRMRA